MIPKTYHFFLLVLVPILIGGIIYALFRSDTLLMFHWFKIIKIDQMVLFFRNSDFFKNMAVPGWIKYSLPDGLWIFSYVSLMILIWNNKISTNSFFWIFLLPIIAILSELGQFAKVVPGTFDVYDLVTYLTFTCLPLILFNHIFIKPKPISYDKI